MKAAWEWLKKYWELLVGALLLLLGFLFGVAIRRRPVIEKPNPVKEEAEREAEAQTREAEQKAADEKAEAKKEHDVDLAVLVKDIQEKTDDVKTDPDKTNEYLKNVGKAVRGDD